MCRKCGKPRHDYIHHRMSKTNFMQVIVDCLFEAKPDDGTIADVCPACGCTKLFTQAMKVYCTHCWVLVYNCCGD